MDRALLESLILSCIYKDITLITEVNEDYFENDKCYFYFKLIKEMSKNAKEVNELSVTSWVNTNNLHDLFNEYGGYDAIRNLMNLDSRVNNFDSYLDSLKKILVLDSYKHLNIDFNRDFEVEHTYVNPITSMPLLNCEEFSNLLMNIVTGRALRVQTEEYKAEQLFFSEQEMYDKINNIYNSGTSFDITLRFTDEEKGNELYIQSFKLLNDTLNGIHSNNGNFQISGHSGVGKSTITLSILMGMIESGRKILLVSNEQEAAYFKNMLSAFICNHVYRCYTISRKRIENNTLNDDEKVILVKANEFIRNKYENRLMFLPVGDFDLPKIFKYAKRLKLLGLCDTLVLDTLKPDSDALSNSGTSALNMVGLSRDLDKFGRENNMITICTSQLATYSEGQGFLNASVLSQGKATKEVAGVLLLWRKVYSNIELNKDDPKYFLKPYIWEYNPLDKKARKRYLTITSGGKSQPWDRHACDTDGVYTLCFVDKSRFGSTGAIILYQTDLRTGRIYEKGFVENVFAGKIVGGGM